MSLAILNSDYDWIFIIGLGILVIIRRHLLNNYRLKLQGLNKISFGQSFNRAFSLTGFIFCLMIIPIKKVDKGGKVFWINLLTVLSYFTIIWIIIISIINV